jgi:hypothetical protein
MMHPVPSLLLAVYLFGIYQVALTHHNVLFRGLDGICRVKF